MEDAIEISEKITLKFTNIEAKLGLNPVLTEVKINNVNLEERKKLIKLKLAVGNIVKELEECEKVTVDSLKDKEYSKLEELTKTQDATEKDKENFKNANIELEKKANELLSDEYNKVNEIEYSPITEDTFYNAICTTDLTSLGGYEYLYNKLVKLK